MPDENTIHFECQYCAQPIEAPPEMRGAEIECPGCGKTVTVWETLSKAEMAAVQRAKAMPPPLPLPPPPPMRYSESIARLASAFRESPKTPSAADLEAAKQNQQRISASNHLVIVGDRFEVVACVLMVIGVVCAFAFFVCLCGEAGGDKNAFQAELSWAGGAGVAFGSAAWSYVIAQLLHIRAALEKQSPPAIIKHSA